MKRFITTNKSRVFLLSCSMLYMFASEARAQAINYSSLEQMFGEPVTLSATGKPQTVSDAPANMIIITAEEIRRSGAATIADLPSRVLKNYAGIDVQQASLASSNVGINGYDQPYSPKLLVLVNGRQVYLDDYGYTEWSAIPIELAEIRQIEVVKGPASALFGFNAANGVINIVTFSPLNDSVREVSATAGSGNYYAGSAVATVHLGENVGLRLSSGADRGDEFAGWTKSRGSYVDRPDRQSVNLDTQARVGGASFVGLELSRALSNETDIATGSNAGEALYRTWSAKGSISSETPIGVISGQAYHNFAQTTAAGNSNVLGTEFDTRSHLENSTTVVQVSDLLQIDPFNAVREALEYRHNELTSEITNRGTIAYDVLAESLMWDWQISPTISWTNAGRVDHLGLSRSGQLLAGFDRTNSYYNHELNAFSYNSGLVDKITEEDTLRIAVGQSILAPSLLEYGTLQRVAIGPVKAILAGDVSIKPTIVKKYEFGFAHAMPADGVTLTGSLYYQKTEDMKGLGNTILRDEGGVLVQSGNSGNSSERGFESGIAYNSRSGLKLDANYTYADILESSHIPGGPLDRLGTPRNKVNLHAGYSFGRWEIDGYAHYVSHIEQQVVGSGGGVMFNVPGYFEIDSRVAYRLTDSLTATISGSSIDLAHHREDAGAQADRRLLGSLSVKF